MTTYALLILTAFVAGTINSIAGGGSFLTFPALVFAGVPSISANASSTVALLPGSLAAAWGYRTDFRRSRSQVFPFGPLLIISFVGGFAGAVLLLSTSQHTFDSLIPWLMMVATLLFLFGQRISPHLRKMIHIGSATIVCVQFLIGAYGGYFGGAIGILMLAAWSLYGLTDIHVMNAYKTILAGAMNGVAVIVFVVAHKVWWPQTFAMLVAAMIGGYTGARTAKRLDPRYVRAAVGVISIGMTIAFFLRGH